MEKTKYDSIFKRLVKNVFFKMLNTEKNAEIVDYEDITSQPVELPKTLDRKADFVFLVTKNAKKSIFQLEIQADNDKNMPNRMLTYLALLNEVYNTQEKGKRKPFMPIRQVVLYLGNLKRDKKLKSKMIFERNFGDTLHKYRIINISEISYEDFLKNKETLVFAILGNFNSLDAVFVIEEIVEISLKFFENITEHNEFLADLVTLATLRQLSEVVKENIEQNPKIMAHNIDFTKTLLFVEGERKGKLADAKEMLLDKLPIAQIVKYTKLTFEQIQKLQDELGL